MNRSSDHGNHTIYNCTNASAMCAAYFGLIVLESVGLIHHQHGPVNGLQDSGIQTYQFVRGQKHMEFDWCILLQVGQGGQGPRSRMYMCISSTDTLTGEYLHVWSEHFNSPLLWQALNCLLCHAPHWQWTRVPCKAEHKHQPSIPAINICTCQHATALQYACMLTYATGTAHAHVR